MKYIFLVFTVLIFRSNSFATTQFDVDTLNEAGCKVTGMADGEQFEALTTGTISEIGEQSVVYRGPNFKLGALMMPEKFTILGKSESRLIEVYITSEVGNELVEISKTNLILGPGFSKQVELSFRIDGKFNRINFSCK